MERPRPPSAHREPFVDPTKERTCRWQLCRWFVDATKPRGQGSRFWALMAQEPAPSVLAPNPRSGNFPGEKGTHMLLEDIPRTLHGTLLRNTLARRLGALSAAVCVVASMFAVLSAGTQASTLPGKLTSGTYTGASGTLRYELYVPSRYKPGTSVPLVVALHGCTETADVYRQLSGWDTLAEAKGFLVVFPEQSTNRNYQRCWNWFLQADMRRGSGEPAMVAGLTATIAQSHSVDRHRTYVAGFSAGGAMANVMAATYPDVYGAVGVGSGCEYNGLPCVGYQGPDPTQTGRQAYAAMGAHARVMPAIVFQGDADNIVAPANAPLIVREWQVTDDYADDGALNGSIPTTRTGFSYGTSPGGRSYTTMTYGDGHGHQLIQYWQVHGMNHAWSGGSATEPYSDPAGPNETAAMYSFFLSHPSP
jgi:poly(hydroxyalkanoate) depolymerase family esterase